MRICTVAVAAAFSACSYDASFDDCAIQCSLDIGCPEGFSCGVEGICRPPGAMGSCDLPDGGGLPSCMNLADPIVDLALFKPAEADQIRSANEDASKADDGSESTRWSSADGTPGHWWLVDLGADHLLTSITTKWEYNAVNYRYDVSISSNGTDFAVAIDETADTRVDQVRTDMFPDPTCTRFVRIRKTDTTGYWAILYTVNVMGR